MVNSNLKNSVWDFDAQGTKDSQGNLKILWNKDAIQNAFRMWLVSSKGEMIRRPSYGGVLRQWLIRPMSDENAQNIRTAILSGLNQNFYPFITPTTLTVEPRYEEHYWLITLIGYCKEYSTDINTTVNVKNLTA